MPQILTIQHFKLLLETEYYMNLKLFCSWNLGLSRKMPGMINPYYRCAWHDSPIMRAPNKGEGGLVMPGINKERLNKMNKKSAAQLIQWIKIN